MGSYANINIGKYNFWWHKDGFGNLLYIFNQNDYKKVVEKDENGEIYTYYKLITNVKKAKQILDSTGYTIELAEKNFNEALKQINFEMNL